MEGMSEKMKKHQQQQTSTPRPLVFHIHFDVQHVNLWTVFNAAVTFVFADACNILMITSPTRQASWQYTLFSALVITILWCSTPQAALGALALLLPRHRWSWRLRRAAAYAGLAVTIAIDCMFAGAVVAVFSIDPRDLFFMIVGSVAIFHFAVFDLLSFLALLREQWAH